MARFCGKCGSRLDQATGLCPHCDAEALAARETVRGDTERASGNRAQRMRAAEPARADDQTVVIDDDAVLAACHHVRHTVRRPSGDAVRDRTSVPGGRVMLVGLIVLALVAAGVIGAFAARSGFGAMFAKADPEVSFADTQTDVEDADVDEAVIEAAPETTEAATEDDAESLTEQARMDAMWERAQADYGLVSKAEMTAHYTRSDAGTDANYPNMGIYLDSYSGEEGIYAAYHMDLDGDDADELVVFDRASGDGADGVRSWEQRMSVYDYDEEVLHAEPVVIFSTEEEGFDKATSDYQLSVYWKEHADHTEILATFYEARILGGVQSDEHLWLTAYRYEDGEIVPDDRLEYEGSDMYGIDEWDNHTDRLRELGLETSADELESEKYPLRRGFLSPDEEVDNGFRIYTSYDQQALMNEIYNGDGNVAPYINWMELGVDNSEALVYAAEDAVSMDLDAEDGADGQVLPGSSVREIRGNELPGYDQDTLQLAINEIYARHGYTFRSEELLAHFRQYDWYEPTVPADEFDESVFSQIERDNIERLQAMKEPG